MHPHLDTSDPDTSHPGRTHPVRVEPKPADHPPLLLLHGLSANGSSWDPVVTRFADRAPVHAPDLRGHGGSVRTPGRYRLADYVGDVERLLAAIGEPTLVVGHSLGAIVAVSLAQARHPLVAGVFLEDPPLYLLDPEAFAASGFVRTFTVLRDHIEVLRAREAPVEEYRDALAAAPHPAGDRLGDHLHDDALWSRATALAQVDTAAITAVLDGTTFAGFDPDRPLHVPGVVVRADPRYDAAFRPEHTTRLHRHSPHVAVIPMPGAGHNVRGDRATRDRYLDVLAGFVDLTARRAGRRRRPVDPNLLGGRSSRQSGRSATEKP